MQSTKIFQQCGTKRFTSKQMIFIISDFTNLNCWLIIFKPKGFEYFKGNLFAQLLVYVFTPSEWHFRRKHKRCYRNQLHGIDAECGGLKNIKACLSYSSPPTFTCFCRA